MECGDFIDSYTGGGTCSSGPSGVNAANQQWIITAAHCFGLNYKIYNHADGINIGNANNYVGLVKAADNRSYGLDAEFLNAEGSDEAWVGSTTSTACRFYNGSAPTNYNYTVCTDGAFEGQICGLTGTGIGETLHICTSYDANGRCISTRFVTHVSEAENINGNEPAAGEGDSGGPVNEYAGAGLYAVGIVTAIGEASYICSNWSTYETRYCSGTVYFTDIGPILDQWGLTMNGTG